MANHRTTAHSLTALGVVVSLIASYPATAGAPPAGSGGTTAPTFSGAGAPSRQSQPQQNSPRTNPDRPAPGAAQIQTPNDGPRGGITVRGPTPTGRGGNFYQANLTPGSRNGGFDGSRGAWNAGRPGLGFANLGFAHGFGYGRGFGPAGMFGGWAFAGGLFGPRAIVPVMAYRGWGFGGQSNLPSRGPDRPAQWGWAGQNHGSFPQQGANHQPSPYQGWAHDGVMGH